MTNAEERDQGAIRRFDEVNLSQHSLISVKERVTDADLNWTVTYSLNGRDYNVSCRGLPDYGSPHGIDTDVSAAIINLFIELGCPDDDTISVTAYQLLKSAGLHINGQNYINLRLSLMRLEGTQYVISRTWRDAKRGRWTSSTFRYLDKVAFTGKAAEEVDEQSLICVTLPRDVTASIRAGYLKPLHLPFMQSLKRPPTRALYRLLDAQRIDPEHPERRIGAFEVKLMDWAQACKLNSDRPDMIRRALAPVHKELIDRGVLTSVEYTGRGQKQIVTYVFGEVAAPPDPRIVAALMQGGVTRPVSEKLAREFSADVIEQAVALHAALLKDGYKARSKGGLLVDVVRNPGKWLWQVVEVVVLHGSRGAAGRQAA
ncbi:replication initiator protein A (plasmid) [Deinococcus taeanensis]|uniref:replication initiator protein A n=1 Tax=Deinococcus taeanensis TaxID=2737050 RepID=UPI001CDBA786|nr:replication initiator protein A [Deinococcus taeanensis]UBV45548.1 replication initiator protein A [Deinococcus taeanensis]